MSCRSLWIAVLSRPLCLQPGLVRVVDAMIVTFSTVFQCASSLTGVTSISHSNSLLLCCVVFHAFISAFVVPTSFAVMSSVCCRHLFIVIPPLCCRAICLCYPIRLFLSPHHYYCRLLSRCMSWSRTKMLHAGVGGAFLRRSCRRGPIYRGGRPPGEHFSC